MLDLPAPVDFDTRARLESFCLFPGDEWSLDQGWPEGEETGVMCPRHRMALWVEQGFLADWGQNPEGIRS